MRNDRLITCAQVDERLADWLENELDADMRVAFEQHVATCVRCAGLVGDVTAIRRDAAALPELTPSRDLWPEIEARIQAPVIALGTPRRAPARSRNVWWMGAAAAALMAVTAGVTHLATKSATTSTQPVIAASEPAVVRGPDSMQADPTDEPVASLASDAEAPDSQPVTRSEGEAAAPPATAGSQYDRDVAQLRTILRQRRGELDSSTVTVLEKNLELIDRAIAESRAALERDPASEFLADQLARVMTKKVAILRTAALLPSRS